METACVDVVFFAGGSRFRFVIKNISRNRALRVEGGRRGSRQRRVGREAGRCLSPQAVTVQRWLRYFLSFVPVRASRPLNPNPNSNIQKLHDRVGGWQGAWPGVWVRSSKVSGKWDRLVLLPSPPEREFVQQNDAYCTVPSHEQWYGTYRRSNVPLRQLV